MKPRRRVSAKDDMAEKEKTKEISENTPESQAADPAKKPLNLFGKEFDVSTPEGVAHAQGWNDAFQLTHGKQAQEIGPLRKFKSAMDSIKTESDANSKATKLLEDGDTGGAINAISDHYQQQLVGERQQHENARFNDQLWDEYFEKNPDASKLYGSKIRARKLAEMELGDQLTTAENSFEVLNAYFGPQVKRLKGLENAEPVDTDTPIIQGGKGGNLPDKANPAPEDNIPNVPSAFETLESNYIPNRSSKK